MAIRKNEFVSMIRLLQGEADKLGVDVRVEGNEVTFVLPGKAKKAAVKPGKQVKAETVKEEKTAKNTAAKTGKPKMYREILLGLGTPEHRIDDGWKKAKRLYTEATGKNATASYACWWLYCQDERYKKFGHEKPLGYNALLSELTGWGK